MLNPGLSATDLQDYFADLAESHEVQMSVRIMTTSHVPVSGNLTSMLIGGQIDGQLIEVNRWTTVFVDFDDPCILHTLTMDLLDPGYTLGFDSATPQDAALYMDRMVEVIRSDYSPRLARWVDCPMFLGPISNLKRDGDIVTVTAQSKEALSADESDLSKAYGAAAATTIIRDILVTAGETQANIQITNRTTMVAKGLALVRGSRPWAKAYYLTKTLGIDLFYDARGQAKFTGDKTPVFVFDGSNIIEKLPSREFGTDQLVNAVRVIVGGGSGDAPKFDVTARLPGYHPNSAASLGRNGVPRHKLITITDDLIPTKAAAQQRAAEELNVRSQTVSGLTLLTLCVPPLELGDFVVISVNGKASIERVTAWTKPLLVTDLMSVGQNRFVPSPVRRAA